ncbi:N-acetylmuramoyl-L-alanine amidase family protein [Teichococcus vastitatis]|uniref:N-acetylmuramoyl-L-alanine amidase n=1 Tax=Teichococcus vastitatis TaxID=2307076 RepID=A0ABS9W561_9PROT|nr:N-acetylmuramoyl-L-alanine amidase [Pseudoroseomonas vastitatis]MCI0754431.1 N-acetylmuramoyl-L-alanine amidase [Pseudoroseomonas vastitatis]
MSNPSGPYSPGPMPVRRQLLRAGLGLAATLSLIGRAEAAVTAARLVRDGRAARLSLTLGRGAEWRLSALLRPARLLLTLPGSPWRAASRLPGAGPVAGARWDGQRLLIDLTGAVEVRASGEGGTLLLEIAPGGMSAYANLARDGLSGQVGGGTAMTAARPATAAARDRPLVVLDPGHGGKDPGTIGVRGTHEKRITLAAAAEMKRQLEAGGRCRVALTRSRDVFVPLDGRVEFARKRGATLFISLHADSAPGARGASVYTLSDRASDSLSARLARTQNNADAAGGLKLPPVSPEVERILYSLVRQETKIGSARLAQHAVDSLGRSVPLLPNTHRQAAFAVLKAPEIPSMLVEMGFLSDRRDEAALNRAPYRAQLCRALTGAVHGWLDRHEAGLASAG